MTHWRRLLSVLIALGALIGGLSVAKAQEADESFDRLSENVKNVVVEVNGQLGDLDGVCNTDLNARSAQINRSVEALKERNELTGFGFYALDAGNYYNGRCRDR
jgi:hypothetical protein